jgi:hypothetical protein
MKIGLWFILMSERLGQLLSNGMKIIKLIEKEIKWKNWTGSLMTKIKLFGIFGLIKTYKFKLIIE